MLEKLDKIGLDIKCSWILLPVFELRILVITKNNPCMFGLLQGNKNAFGISADQVMFICWRVLR
jgi:hypothetical protein